MTRIENSRPTRQTRSSTVEEVARYGEPGRRCKAVAASEQLRSQITRDLELLDWEHALVQQVLDLAADNQAAPTHRIEDRVGLRARAVKPAAGAT